MIARAIQEHRTVLPDDSIAHLVRSYGSGDAFEAIVQMVRSDPALGARVDAASPVIIAQLRYAALFEHARSAEDIVMRRTELGATARVSPSALLAARHEIELRAAAEAAKDGDQELRADSLPGRPRLAESVAPPPRGVEVHDHLSHEPQRDRLHAECREEHRQQEQRAIAERLAE